MKEVICLCLFFVPFCGNSSPAAEPSKLPAAQQPALMRIVAPVRLSSEPGEKLSAEVSRTRETLDKFRKAGFEYAVWAVDALPAKDKDIESWAKTCLKAFPGKAILALDSGLEKGKVSPDPVRLRLLLKACGPSVHAVIANYSRLNNAGQSNTAEAAIKAVADTARLVKEVSPGTACWLFLDDEPASAAGIPAWVRGLENLTDGFYLDRGHGLKALSDASFGSVVATLRVSGKPVIRGGFLYTAPHERPGLEKDLRDQYLERMGRYERWLAGTGYAGYSRDMGESVPGGTGVNLAYVPGI